MLTIPEIIDCVCRRCDVTQQELAASKCFRCIHARRVAAYVMTKERRMSPNEIAPALKHTRSGVSYMLKAIGPDDIRIATTIITPAPRPPTITPQTDANVILCNHQKWLGFVAHVRGEKGAPTMARLREMAGAVHQQEARP